MRIGSLILKCHELSYFVTIHLTHITFYSSNLCWCPVLLLPLALNILLVKTLAQGREDLCIHWEVNHPDSKADSCKKKDSWKESCKQGISSCSQLPNSTSYGLSWVPQSGFIAFHLQQEYTPRSQNKMYGVGKIVSWEDIWECKPSQANPELPAFCMSKLFGLSHTSGLIHSSDRVWTVKGCLQAVGPGSDGSSAPVTLMWMHQVQTDFK